jgi:hypothetical protein
MSIEERIYSEAFEDGVNYAIQRMFGDDEKNEGSYLRSSLTGAGLGFGAGAFLGRNLVGKDTLKEFDSINKKYQEAISDRNKMERRAKYADEYSMHHRMVGNSKKAAELAEEAKVARGLNRLNESEIKRLKPTYEKLAKKVTSRSIGIPVAAGAGIGALSHYLSKKKDNKDKK